MRGQRARRVAGGLAGVLAAGVLLGGCTDHDVSRFFDALVRVLVVALVLYLLVLFVLLGLFVAGVALMVSGVRRHRRAGLVPAPHGDALRRDATVRLAIGAVLTAVPAGLFLVNAAR